MKLIHHHHLLLHRAAVLITMNVVPAIHALMVCVVVSGVSVALLKNTVENAAKTTALDSLLHHLHLVRARLRPILRLQHHLLLHRAALL